MSEKKIAGLYWTKEDIDSACQVYAVHIAVTNHLVCTIDTDVPSAENFANLFVAGPDLLEALKANHEWHLMYDDTGSYCGSELWTKNTEAIAKVK